MLTRALVRPPGANFAEGLTRVDLGPPSLRRALEQHRAYCDALVRCGLELTVLPPDPTHPDATFVEDTAVLADGAIIITRPGAPSRAGEIVAIRAAFADRGLGMSAIHAPGTLDGGDVCIAGKVAFIGRSARTNADGADQLAAWFDAAGFDVRLVDITALGSILHLKSGLAAIGDGRLLVIEDLRRDPAFADFECVVVDRGEEYAGNALRINDHVLVAHGYPKLHTRLAGLGYRTLVVELGEFAKMDGGASCLSLRW
jgi:dimethylargininase